MAVIEILGSFSLLSVEKCSLHVCYKWMFWMDLVHCTRHTATGSDTNHWIIWWLEWVCSIQVNCTSTSSPAALASRFSSSVQLLDFLGELVLCQREVRSESDTHTSTPCQMLLQFCLASVSSCFVVVSLQFSPCPPHSLGKKKDVDTVSLGSH